MAHETSANLEIVFAVSWKWGNVTPSAHDAYATHIKSEEASGKKDNSWTPKLVGVSGGGAIFWKVQCPLSADHPTQGYTFSSVQTTLINDLENNTTQSIDYEPSRLQNSPFTANPNGDLVVCAARWGDQDLTATIQNLVTGLIRKRASTLKLRMSEYSNGPADKSSYVCIVYAYTSSVGRPIDVQICGYDAHESEEIVISLSPPPKLTILGALLGKLDITAGLQGLVTDQQSLSVHLKTIEERFSLSASDSLPLTVLSVLYQHQGHEMRCWAGRVGEGNLSITPYDASPAINLVRNPRAGEPNVLALVWGDGSATGEDKIWPLAEGKNDKIMVPGSFKPDKEWFGTNPMRSFRSSCHVYYTYGVTGAIRSLAVFDGETATLQPRDWSFLDPKPAQGFLNPYGAKERTEFKLKTFPEGKYIGITPESTLSEVHLRTTSEDEAAIFAFVPLNTENNDIRMLKVRRRGNEAYWYYLGSRDAWDSRATSSATFLSRGEVGTSFEHAFAANYEVAVGSTDDGLVFCATKPTNDKVPYQPGVRTLVFGAEDGINLVPLSQAISSPTFMFTPEFFKGAGAIALQPRSNILNDVSPCQISLFSMIFHLASGAVQFILPVYNITLTDIAYRVGGWIRQLELPFVAKLLSFFSSVQAFFRGSVSDTNGNGSASRMVSLIGFVWRFIRLLWAERGATWSLITYLFMKGSPNYWTICKYGYQLVGLALKYTNVATAAAYTLVQWTVWCISFRSNGMNVVRDCVTSWVEEKPHALLRARRLTLALAKVRESQEIRALPEHEQFDVMHALSSPAIEHVLAETNGSDVPRVHPLIDWHDNIYTGEGLQQRHLEDSHAGLYIHVSPSALEIARQFAPEIQDSIRE